MNALRILQTYYYQRQTLEYLCYNTLERQWMTSEFVNETPGRPVYWKIVRA